MAMCDFCNELRRTVRREIKTLYGKKGLSEQDRQRVEENGMRGLAARLVALLQEAEGE